MYALLSLGFWIQEWRFCQKCLICFQKFLNTLQDVNQIRRCPYRCWCFFFFSPFFLFWVFFFLFSFFRNEPRAVGTPRQVGAPRQNSPDVDIYSRNSKCVQISDSKRSTDRKKHRESETKTGRPIPILLLASNSELSNSGKRSEQRDQFQLSSWTSWEHDMHWCSGRSSKRALRHLIGTFPMTCLKCDRENDKNGETSNYIFLFSFSIPSEHRRVRKRSTHIHHIHTDRY